MMYRMLFASTLASLALAKTDLTGCTSTDVSSPAGASIAWYVPGTGELCEFLDCGGGRAPPKTTVPGCPLYSGTATYSPSYLPGYNAASMTSAPTASSVSAAVTSTSAEASDSTSSGDSPDTTSNILSNTVVTGPESALSSSLITSHASASVTSMATGGSSNGTFSSGAPSSGSPSAASTGGAMETGRAWVGGVAMVGLGAIVAAL